MRARVRYKEMGKGTDKRRWKLRIMGLTNLLVCNVDQQRCFSVLILIQDLNGTATDRRAAIPRSALAYNTIGHADQS